MLLTVHQLLLLHRNGKIRFVSFEVQSQDMKSCTSLMALHCQWASLVLHSEIIAHGTGAIANEAESTVEASSRKELAEEVVESSLRKQRRRDGKS